MSMKPREGPCGWSTGSKGRAGQIGHIWGVSLVHRAVGSLRGSEAGRGTVRSEFVGDPQSHSVKWVWTGGLWCKAAQVRNEEGLDLVEGGMGTEKRMADSRAFGRESL